MWVFWKDKALCQRASYQIVFVGVNCPWRCLFAHHGFTMSALYSVLATPTDLRHCSIDLSWHSLSAWGLPCLFWIAIACADFMCRVHFPSWNNVINWKCTVCWARGIVWSLDDQILLVYVWEGKFFLFRHPKKCLRLYAKLSSNLISQRLDVLAACVSMVAEAEHLVELPSLAVYVILGWTMQNSPP